MNDREIETILRRAEPVAERVAPEASAALAARVREVAAGRATRRRRTAGVFALVGILTAAGLAAVLVRPGGSAPPPVVVHSPASQESALRLIVQRSERDAEVASMVVRELRTRGNTGATARPPRDRDPRDVAAVEIEQAANVLLAHVRTFADTPALREAVEWRCELIIGAFPESAAAREARAVLDSNGRSESASSLAQRKLGGVAPDTFSGASS